MQRIQLDLKAPAGRGAFLRLAESADVVLESFRPGVVDRLGVGYGDVRCGEPRRRLLLDERLRPDRAPRAVGRPRRQLLGRRRLPRLQRAGAGRQAAAARSHRGRHRRRRDAGRDGDHDRPRPQGSHRRGCLPRRVDRRRRARHDGPLHRRVPGHGNRAGPGPLHPHRALRLLRHLRVRGRQVGGGGRDRAAVLRQPLPAAGLREVGGPPTRRRRAGPDPSRLPRRVRDQDSRRVGSRAGAGRHVRGAGVHGRRADRRRPGSRLAA